MILPATFLLCQCLSNWDHTNSKALVQALRELLIKYREYQEGLLTTNARLQFEYVTLVETSQFTDMEVHQVQKTPYVSLKLNHNQGG